MLNYLYSQEINTNLKTPAIAQKNKIFNFNCLFTREFVNVKIGYIIFCQIEGINSSKYPQLMQF